MENVKSEERHAGYFSGNVLGRTHSGIARAKTAGNLFDRPSALNEEQQLTVIFRIDGGISISIIAREFNTTRQTILRVKARQDES
ncbi:hypothetical protein ASE93_23250 [Serratia sp. Leaf50]|nr:hypothetical protein ASE93_23250 [Serratia sp. Leaf50]